MVQVSKRLVITKQVPMDTSKELMNSLDVALADHHCNNKNFEKGLQIYKTTLPLIQEHEYNFVFNRFLNHTLQYAKILSDDKKWADAVEIYHKTHFGGPECNL